MTEILGVIEKYPSLGDILIEGLCLITAVEKSEKLVSDVAGDIFLL